MWVRGLKQANLTYDEYAEWVAPRVGAWIETLYATQNKGMDNVAPRVGAWIETEAWVEDMYEIVESHPVWVRGLKQRIWQ